MHTKCVAVSLRIGTKGYDKNENDDCNHRRENLGSVEEAKAKVTSRIELRVLQDLVWSCPVSSESNMLAVTPGDLEKKYIELCSLCGSSWRSVRLHSLYLAA